ncbi:MAG TPA: HlyD family efflux transporter periplasmic adaptor subunit [Terriglobia bacterium]|nr:HlyD family efflux transporter periplasmic adaptor subunit [Terriglobia bacterium]
MDIQRPSMARRRRIKRIVYSAAGLLLVLGISLGLSRLKPAAPSVEWSTVWPDTVKRGPMLRQVRGNGTLVPEEIRWIPALTEGRVERLRLLPGAPVRADTVLLDLSNPQLDLDLLDAQSQLKAGEAEYLDLQVSLESQRLDQQAAAAKVQAEYNQAKLQADRDEILAREGLTPDLTLKLSKVIAEELANRYEIEKKRLEIYAESIKAQLAVQKTKVEQYRALYELRKSQVDALHVKAGTDGVLQQLPVEVGESVAPGTNLARVAEPKRLKAALKIPETQAKDIMIGQPAVIDTRNGTIPGRVTRIDPASENGTVTVDVALAGELPKGARPDLSVDGTIELERLDDVLYVGRPVQAQQESLVTLFRVDPDRRGAVRVKVRFGRSSVNTIEVIEGLTVGDQVLLSDMSTWDAYDRIRLN